MLFFKNTAKKERGFTMLELLSTVAIASIIAGFAIPNIEAYQAANNKTQTMNQFVALLTDARKSAVNRATKVVVCPIDENASCSEDWTLPVSVFADDNDNQTIEYNEDVLNSLDLSAVTQSVKWQAFSKKPFIQFDDAGASGDQSGRLFLCDTTSTNHKVIIVTPAGHTRVDANEETTTACL